MIYGSRVDSSARTDIMIIIEILTTCYTVTVAGDGPSNGPSSHAHGTRSARGPLPIILVAHALLLVFIQWWNGFGRAGSTWSTPPTQLTITVWLYQEDAVW